MTKEEIKYLYNIIATGAHVHNTIGSYSCKESAERDLEYLNKLNDGYHTLIIQATKLNLIDEPSMGILSPDISRYFYKFQEKRDIIYKRKYKQFLKKFEIND